MAIAAGLSVVALVGVGGWQIWGALHNGATLQAENTSLAPLPERAKTPFSGLDWQSELVAEAPASADLPAEGSAQAGSSGAARGDVDGLSNIAGNVTGVLLESYATLAEGGEYTPEAGERIAGDVAESLRARVSYKIYGAGDITTTSDTSYGRMLAYRGDMQIALGPLLKNTDYELNIFARYIESGDAEHLVQLERTAENYRAAVENAAQLTVPVDALPHHIRVLNALSEFAATLDGLKDNAGDPFASVALLRTYNTAEQNVYLSFDALARYARNKQS